MFRVLNFAAFTIGMQIVWGVGTVVIVASDQRFAVYVGSPIVWWDISNAFHIARFCLLDVVATVKEV